MRSHRCVSVLALLSLLLGGVLAHAPGTRAIGAWTPAAAPTTPGGDATTLQDGRVLLTTVLPFKEGVAERGVTEVYDPAMDRWSARSPLPYLQGHAAPLLLPDGRVFFSGGSSRGLNPGSRSHLNTAQLYDPAADAWTPVAAMGTVRGGHTATLLADGTILVAGGDTTSSSAPSRPTGSVERFDPRTGRWSPAAPLAATRFGHTATRLPDGRVLVVGGRSSGAQPNVTANATATAELYDPAANRWFPAASLTTPRSFPLTASLLPDGRVLVIGRQGPDTSPRTTAELYDPAADRWTPAGTIGTPQIGHTATLLPNGQVLVAGGMENYYPPELSSTELYDPAADRWTPTAPLLHPHRLVSAVSLLPGGHVLVLGGTLLGDGTVEPSTTTEIYDPVRDVWVGGAPMTSPRARPRAVALKDGRVLVIGGTAPPSAEIYNAAPGPQACFAETGQCVAGRFLEYWRENGGLARNGFPLSPVRTEVLEDGRAYRVQYFERVRLEYHPENAPPYDVLLGQFGRRIHPADPPVPPPGGPITQDGLYFTATGHYVPGRFFGFWNANGGLRQFGYPISEAFEETLEDGRAYRVQYFERARLEYHPENAPPYDVLLGQFGRQILAENDLLGTSTGSTFGQLYIGNEEVRGTLGAPVGPQETAPGVAQAFERGRMYYRGDTGRIVVFCGGVSGIVLLAPGRETAFPDTWTEGQDPGGGPAPAPGLFYPRRGFGKLWRENQRVRDCLGYARTGTEEGYTFAAQPFRRGLMLGAAPSEGRTIHVVALGPFGNGTGPEATYAPYSEPSR